ncbi:MAG TPA: DUF1990 family protein [Planctomycetota bacterium]|jgi:hypothetical protein|nr:DUF1990 family protein [Planctomycetota bacterium]
MQIIATLFAGAPRLDGWEARPFWAGVERGPGPRDRRDTYEREVAFESPGPPEPEGPFRRLAAEILAYRIFPARWISPVLRRAPVETGDTVGILYHAGPGVDFFFAARVVKRFDERDGSAWKAGFTYRTLRGHPELGEETFAVEKDLATGKISVALRSWSRPGTLLARIFAPIVRIAQVRASHAALGQLAAMAR